MNHSAAAAISPKVSFSYTFPPGADLGLGGLHGEHFAPSIMDQRRSVEVAKMGGAVSLRVSYTQPLTKILVDVMDRQAGRDGTLSQLERRGRAMVEFPGVSGPTIWNPYQDAFGVLVAVLERLAAEAVNPVVRTRFEDDPWGSLKDLTVTASGTTVAVKFNEPFYTMGSPPRPGSEAPTKALPATRLRAALKEGPAVSTPFLFRGDLARETSEAMIAVALWTTAMEVTAYAGWKRKKGGTPPDFKPVDYLQARNKHGLPSTDLPTFIACNELWGCRHEMIHNGRASIRTADAYGITSKKALRPFTWDDADRFRRAVAAAIVVLA